jgi:hypothetical protein
LHRTSDIVGPLMLASFNGTDCTPRALSISVIPSTDAPTVK